MKRKFIPFAVFLTGSLLLISFQNCARTNFEAESTGADGAMTKSSGTGTAALGSEAEQIASAGSAANSGTTVASQPSATPKPTSPAGTPVPLPGGVATVPPSSSVTQLPIQAPSNPEAANVCYDVTCVSDAWGMKTITGTTNQYGVISALAPSTGSSWIISITSDHKVGSFLNCFPNEILSQNTPDFYGSSLCEQNAPQTSYLYNRSYFPNGASFTVGAGKYMRSCEQSPCGYMKTDSRTESSGLYEWASATLNKSTGAAAVKIRMVDYAAHYRPQHVSVDAMVPPGQCSVQQTVVYNTSNGQSVQLLYQICLSAQKLVTITTNSPSATIQLDLSTLTNLSTPTLTNAVSGW